MENNPSRIHSFKCAIPHRVLREKESHMALYSQINFLYEKISYFSFMKKLHFSPKTKSSVIVKKTHISYIKLHSILLIYV
jgi:hypothetical protein